jgi:signal transduction histidine kinase
MRLEEVLVARELTDIRAEAEAALAEADRLEATIAALLTVARGGTAEGRAVDLAAVVEESVVRWAPLFDVTGRRIEARCEARPVARAAEPVVSQVLDVLIDNALHHGAGTVTVAVHAASGHPAARVSDEGDGVPEGMEGAVFERHVSASGRTGVGLALARTLAESAGGRLELVSARPAVFELYLAAWSAAPARS